MIHTLTKAQQDFLHELAHAPRGLPLFDLGKGAARKATFVTKPLLLTTLVHQYKGDDGVGHLRLTAAGHAFVLATQI